MIRHVLALACLFCAASLCAAEKKADKHAGAVDGYFLRKGDVVLCLGDSNTENTKWMYLLFYSDLAKQYPELVGNPPAAYAHDAFKGPLTLVNAGVSGDTAAGGAARLQPLLDQWKPTVCVVCFGMNDRYKDRAGFIGNMKQIVEKLKAAKIEVTLLSPTSTYPINPDLKTYIPILGDMNKEIAALAAEEHVGYADAYTASAEWIAAGKPDYTFGDGIHVGDQGQRFMVDALNACWGFGKSLANEGPRPAQTIPGGDAKSDKSDKSERKDAKKKDGAKPTTTTR